MSESAKPGNPAASPVMMPGARYCMTIEPPRVVKTSAFDYPFEVQVSLPATYQAAPDRRYSVMWLTDGPAMLPLATGLLDWLVMANTVPELILVGVGSPPAVGVMEQGRRRGEFLAPPGDRYFYGGLAGQTMEKMMPPDYQLPAQKGDKFLDFLVDELRPAIAAEYRTTDEHGLFGHSGGGMFTGYAMFARPGAFTRFIIGSPSLNAADKKAFALEEAYAAANTDLDARVFFGAGDREIDNKMMAAWGLVSCAVLMAETLHLRNYPSLQVTTRIFSGKDHLTVLPDILHEGIRAVWGLPAPQPAAN